LCDQQMLGECLEASHSTAIITLEALMTA